MTRQHGNRFYSTSVSPKRVERIRFELFLTPMPVSVRAPLANLVVHTANALAGDEGSATRALALAELGGVAEPGRGRLNPSDETCGAGGSSDELGNIGESLAAASRCGEGVGTADGGQCREGDE